MAVHVSVWDHSNIGGSPEFEHLIVYRQVPANILRIAGSYIDNLLGCITAKGIIDVEQIFPIS